MCVCVYVVVLFILLKKSMLMFGFFVNVFSLGVRVL